MKSVLDDEMETMSMTSVASEAPMEADKYDLQFDVKEEGKILAKIKGLNLYFKQNEKYINHKLNNLLHNRSLQNPCD